MSAAPNWMEFEEFDRMRGVAHRFVLRQPGIDVKGDRNEVIRRLWQAHAGQVRELGFAEQALVLAEQVHGAQVELVRETTPPGYLETGVDGLVSNVLGRVLGIYVADCCAVYLADEEAGSIGLVHSGKKGSELNIVGEAISRMMKEHGADPQRMRVRLSPCIRPPQYEVDFAAKIRSDARLMGVPAEQIFDDGCCTGGDAVRFYSYRMEMGRTGRMLALLGLK